MRVRSNSSPILRLFGDLSLRSQYTPRDAMSSAMVGVLGFWVSAIELSAGPGEGCLRIHLAAIRDCSLSLMRGAASLALIFRPLLGPAAPYHSSIAISVPARGFHFRPSGIVAAVPSASAHQMTLNGLALPQS